MGPSVTSQELKGLRLLVDLYLLRRLPPLEANVGKRLVKSPKLYLRDSGLVHALLGLRTLEDLLAHPLQISQKPLRGAEGVFARRRWSPLNTSTAPTGPPPTGEKQPLQPPHRPVYPPRLAPS